MLDCAQKHQPLWPMCPARPHSQSPSLGETAPGHRTLSYFSGGQAWGSQASQVGWGGRVPTGPKHLRDLQCLMCFSTGESRLGGGLGALGLHGKEGGERLQVSWGTVEKPTSGVHKAVTTNKAAVFNLHPANNLDWPYFIFRRADLIFLPKPLCSYKVEETLYPLGLFPK